MKEISELKFNPSVLYCAEHTWAKQEGDIVIVGITDFAQNQLDEVIFVELPQAGDVFSANEVFGVVESVKSVSDLFMPISGEIVEANHALEDDPGIINSSPFEDAWMIKVKISNSEELAQLLSVNDYKAAL